MERATARRAHNRVRETTPAGAACAYSGPFYFAYYYAFAIEAEVAPRAL